tara:strand:- start:1057 stop:1206 length:150 start_codon:yes stop_codon:yes gene_type:complete
MQNYLKENLPSIRLKKKVLPTKAVNKRKKGTRLNARPKKTKQKKSHQRK